MITLNGYDTYYGGKNGAGVYQTIINHIPKHLIYGEPFLGRGTIMRLKKPAPALNFGCDLDKQLIQSWKHATKDMKNFVINVYNGIDFLAEAADINFFEDVVPEDVFIFCDPPYLLETRLDTQKRYNYEFTYQDHLNLLTIIKKLSYNVAISCYDNDLYKSELQNWNKITYKSSTRKGQAIETLYMNYPHPEILHDYQFIGNNFRERERIKQKIKRHVELLKRLPVHERNAIVEAITNKV